MRLVLAISVFLIACGGAHSDPKTSAEVPPPSGKGTKRALVLEDGPAPAASASPATAADALSTPSIVQKVLADVKQ